MYPRPNQYEKVPNDRPIPMQQLSAAPPLYPQFASPNQPAAYAQPPQAVYAAGSVNGQQVFYAQPVPVNMQIPVAQQLVQQPVVAQPVQQPVQPPPVQQPVQQPVQRWSHSFCSCNPNVCCMTLCCGPCRWATTMSRAGVMTYRKALFVMLVPMAMYMFAGGMINWILYNSAQESSTQYFEGEEWDYSDYVWDYSDYVWDYYSDYSDYFSTMPVIEPTYDSVSTMPVTDEDWGWATYTDYFSGYPSTIGTGVSDMGVQMIYFLGMLRMGQFAVGVVCFLLVVWGRQQLRKIYHIPGSVCTDCFTWYFCSPCALAQEAMHVDTANDLA
jgi:Cys-rich protein (TIGR01571 family)